MFTWQRQRTHSEECSCFLLTEKREREMDWIKFQPKNIHSQAIKLLIFSRLSNVYRIKRKKIQVTVGCMWKVRGRWQSKKKFFEKAFLLRAHKTKKRERKTWNNVDDVNNNGEKKAKRIIKENNIYDLQDEEKNCVGEREAESIDRNIIISTWLSSSHNFNKRLLTHFSKKVNEREQCIKFDLRESELKCAEIVQLSARRKTLFAFFLPFILFFLFAICVSQANTRQKGRRMKN